MKEVRKAEIVDRDQIGFKPINDNITFEYDTVYCKDGSYRDIYKLLGKQVASIPHSQIVLTHKNEDKRDPDLYSKLPFSDEIKKELLHRHEHLEDFGGQIIFKESDVLELLAMQRNEFLLKGNSNDS